MNYISHRSGAVLATVGTLQVFNIMNIDISPLEIAIMTGTCLMGAYFPDVDHPKSHVVNKNSIFIIIERILMCIPLIAILILNALINFFGYKMRGREIFLLTHRGITHAPFIWLFLLVCTKVRLGSSGIISDYIIGGFFLGILSHMLLDLLAGGLPLLYPFRAERVKLPCNIHTNSLEERRIYGLMNLISLINVLILIGTN